MTQSDRDQRLAAKLRENLKRRKQQARARRAGDAIEEDFKADDKAPVADQKTGASTPDTSGQ